MKKLILTVALLCTLLLGAFAIVSCSGNQVRTPSYVRFDIDTQTLKWNKVPGARAYEVDIEGQERVKTTSSNTFSVEFLEAGTYTVRIRSISGNPEIDPSDWITAEFERAEENGLKYKLINNRSEYQITGSGTAFGDVVVKSTYRGKPVTAIADKAFYNNKKLTSITFEGGITSIGKSAFAKCAELTTITLPDTVTSLGENAFQSCKKLTTITIPGGVTELKPYTFSWCVALSTVNISSGITSIGEYAFSNCDALTNITIPDTVKSIGEYAFSDCEQLGAINLGNGMETIGDYAFVNCIGATSINLGNSLKSIGLGAFTGCNLVTDITVPDSTVSIGSEAFAMCEALDTIKLGTGLQQIGAYAFYGTAAMTNAEGYLYERMTSKILPYSLHTVLWYQGESNVSESGEEAEIYLSLLEGLIDSWRGEFKDGELPFIVIQLADFDGSVLEVMPEAGQVKVTLTIFGRETPVELTLDQVVTII